MEKMQEKIRHAENLVGSVWKEYFLKFCKKECTNRYVMFAYTELFHNVIYNKNIQVNSWKIYKKYFQIIANCVAAPIVTHDLYSYNYQQ